jgi:hypothetical protein
VMNSLGNAQIKQTHFAQQLVFNISLYVNVEKAPIGAFFYACCLYCCKCLGYCREVNSLLPDIGAGLPRAIKTRF